METEIEDASLSISIMPSGTATTPRPRTSSAKFGRGGRIPSSSLSGSFNSSDQYSGDNVRRSSARGRRGATFREISSGSIEAIPEAIHLDQINPEEKLRIHLQDCLRECSRQRLRAIHMSLRHYGTENARVSQKDLHAAMTENHVKLSNRLFQMLIETYEDNFGVDYERLYKCLVAAHNGTGRDSVMALQSRNDLETRQELPPDQRDDDFLKRLERMLIRDQSFFDIAAIRASFQNHDRNKSGKISTSEVFMCCSDSQFPLYGSLLKNLVKRCDDEKNGMISWPEFLSFLEKSQKNAINKHPDLALLPEKKKQAPMAIPDPIDELNSETKSRLVSKILMKKASMKKAGNKSSANAQQQQKAETKTLPKKETIPETNEPTEGEVDDKKVKKTASMDAEGDNKKTSGLTKSSSGIFGSIGLTKSPSGILGSMTTLLTGKKKSGDLQAVPLIDADQPTHAKRDTTEAQKETANKDALYDISGKVAGRRAITVYKPPGYYGDKISPEPPNERLKLDWVYGYRGNDCRSNIYVLSSGEVVYFISNVAILYIPDAHTQRHYREHTEDIKCMAVHSNGVIVATGQFAGKHGSTNQAHVRVWRADTMQTTQVIGMGHYEKAVMCMAFPKVKRENISSSKDTGKKRTRSIQDHLATVDNSPEKKLLIWDIFSGELVGEEVLSTEVICDVGFNNKYPEILVTIGKEHIMWWKMYAESNAVQTLAQPEYEGYLRARFIICLIHNDKGDLITGDSNGTIYFWGDGGHKITNFVKHAHDGPVFTLLNLKGYLISGGRDTMIYAWQKGKNMDASGALQIPKNEGGVRMLQMFRDSLFIGSTMNSMISVKLPTHGPPLEGVVFNNVCITQSHFDDVRGLTAIHGSKLPGDVITAGVDGILCVFNTESMKSVWKQFVKGTPFTCVDCAQGGQLMATGTKEGHLVIMELQTDLSILEILNSKISKEPITTVKISPDGKQVAIGSNDNAIYVYAFRNKENGKQAWELAGRFAGHTMSITALDWSKEIVKDSFIIRSSCGQPTQKIWVANTMDECNDLAGLKDVKWSSHNCRLDASVYGLWFTKQGMDAEINAVDVNSTKSAVAMGNNQGYVSVFRYPCSKEGMYCHTYKSHTTIQNLCFTDDGKFLLTAGGRDGCLMQWRVV